MLHLTRDRAGALLCPPPHEETGQRKESRSKGSIRECKALVEQISILIHLTTQEDPTKQNSPGKTNDHALPITSSTRSASIMGRETTSQQNKGIDQRELPVQVITTW